MNITEARNLLMDTIRDWAEADSQKLDAEARIESDKLFVQGVVTRFPELKAELAAGLLADLGSPGETPKGSEAVLKVLQVNENRSFSVPEMVAALQEKGWLPDSDDPPNAVRAALERLLKSATPGVKKFRQRGAVTYRYNEPEIQELDVVPALAFDPMQTMLSGGPHPENDPQDVMGNMARDARRNIGHNRFEGDADS